MKSKLFNALCGFLLISICINAQSPQNGYNYIQSTTLTEPVKDAGAISALSASKKNVTISYYDGLGRPMQSVSWQASPSNRDIVKPIVYDEFGRQEYQLLPYQSNTTTGEFRSNPNMDNYHGTASEHKTFYSNSSNDVVSDAYPFSKTVYDNSPLNRVMEQGAPGASWQPSNHSIIYEYGTNIANDVCLMWTEDATGNLRIGKSINGIHSKYYPANELYKKVVKDENWEVGQDILLLNTTEEYTDKEGKVILKRTFVEKSSGYDKVETYYVYDSFGLLRYVISPKASIYFRAVHLTSFTSENDYITHSCYYYEYDGRKRMVMKQIPGTLHRVYMVYDKRDRLVLTQDGNQRANIGPKWSFTKYDQLNRPIQTGELTMSKAYDQPGMQQYMDSVMHNRTMHESRTNSYTNYYYSNTGFPNSSDGIINYLTITYYDSYPTTPSFSVQHNISDYRESDATPYYFNGLKGLVTRKMVRGISPDGNSSFITTNYFYDDRYRVIQSIEKPDFNTTEIFSYKYDFSGQTVQTRQFLSFNSEEVAINKYFTYDHVGRLLTVEQQIEGDDVNGRVIVSKHEYNQLGQLKRKQLHKTVDMSGFLQSIDYEYNIRSWLTAINNPDAPGNDLFSMRLHYNSLPDLVHSQPNYPIQYNGNITAQTWNNKDKRGSLYSYDALNRLTANVDLLSSSNQWLTYHRNREYDINYDINGNIRQLKRTNSGGQLIDNLIYLGYAYLGNRLDSVSDVTKNSSGYQNTGSFSYDENGNMISKGSTQYSYNSLNLLSKVSGNYVDYRYIYDAEGRKLRKEYVDLTAESGEYDETRYYNNGIESYWTYSQIDRLVDLIHHDEGVVKVTYGNGFTPIYSYEYFLKDHLGNTRVAFKRGSGETAIALQRSDYYSFGLRTMPYNPESDNKYLYNGKELQDETGWYDYGARMYDPALGRFHTVDPLAFKYSALSPYCYVGNRPTVAIDPDGREIVIVGPNKAQTYNDLAIIYATPMGRQMIEALHNSSNVYKIGGGGWFPTSSSYSPFWNRATYYQGDAEVRGNKYRSFEMLGHELYHAYQDETGNIKGRSKFSVEKEAVKFENYLRKIYSDGAGSQRLKYGGEELFGILEPTSFNTGGEKRDANTAKSYVQVNGGLGEAKQEGNEDEGTAKQDNTRVVLNANTFQRIFEYMENNNLQRVTIDF